MYFDSVGNRYLRELRKGRLRLTLGGVSVAMNSALNGVISISKWRREYWAALRSLVSRAATSNPVNQRSQVALSQSQQLIIGEESSMQPRTGIFAFTLSTATCFGMVARAADLPKEGTSTGTFSYVVGTFKPTPVGKERLLTSWDGNGLSFTNGFGDHMSWHCWATGDYTNGVGLDRGYCVATDTSGDQLIDIFNDDKHALDAKSFGLGSRSLGILGPADTGQVVDL
jgi:hypothetical protein